MSHSEQINELASALAKAQGQIKNPVRDKTANIRTKAGATYSYSYVDLATVWEAIRKPLSDNALSVTQIETDVNGGWFLDTTLWHGSGQWVRSYHPLPNPSGIEPREWASLHTYARRYAISALVGIAPDEDDDADTASQAKPTVGSAAIPNAAGKPLTRDQIDTISFYAKELSPERVRAFLNWLNIKTMTEITQANYDRAIAGLKKATGLDMGAGTGRAKGNDKAVAAETADEPATAE